MPKRGLAWAELKVGAVIIIALAILSAIIVLVVGVESPFARRYTLYTYLPNIGGLRPGSQVLLDGVEAGTVDSYELAEIEKGVRVKMRILQKYQDRIRTDSIAKLRSLGLLGDKYIEINQGSLNARVLNDGEAITGAPPLDLDQMIARGTNSFDTLTHTVDNIKHLTDGILQGKGTVGRLFQDEAVFKNMNEVLRKAHEGPGTVSSLLSDRALYRELNATAANLRKVTDRIEKGEGAAGKLLNNPDVANSLEGSIKRLEVLLARIEKGEGSLGRLSTDAALYNNLARISDNLRPVTEKLSRGDGTVGKLFQDKELYNNTNKLMAELVMLVHDVRQDPKKYLRIRFSIF